MHLLLLYAVYSLLYVNIIMSPEDTLSQIQEDLENFTDADIDIMYTYFGVSNLFDLSMHIYNQSSYNYMEMPKRNIDRNSDDEEPSHKRENWHDVLQLQTFGTNIDINDIFEDAVLDENIEKIQALLRDPQVDPSFDNNWSIKRAVEAGNVDIVRLLLSNPRVDPSDENNYAIITAAENGHIEIVKLLLNNPRVDPSERDNWAIRSAAMNGHLEIVKLLLTYQRVDPSSFDNHAIQLAAENGHLEIVKLLLNDDNVDPSDNDNHAIQEAAMNGHLEIVKELLNDDRVDPSDKNNYAIRYAACNGHLEVVKLLLTDPRVDPSDNDNWAIRYAAKNGHTEIVKLLLNYSGPPLPKNMRNYQHKHAIRSIYSRFRVNPSDDDNLAIKWAAYYGHLEIVKLLLKDQRVRDLIRKNNDPKNNYPKLVIDILKEEYPAS